MAAAKGSVGKGDLVYIDYDAFLADNDKLFDTTMAESAKNAGFFDEKYQYEPMPVLLGSGKLFEVLEAAIENATVGKETEVKIASADAAGARDPKLVELHSIKEFYKQEVNPYPGLEVQLGNRRGTVMSAGAGRVKVDFNNPLAGKDLVYKFTVREVVSDKIEKAKAVVKMSLGTSDGFEFTITDDKISVILPELTKFDQNWTIARFRIVSDLRKVAEVDTVEFIEVWSLADKKSADGDSEKKPAKKKAAPKEAKAEEGAVKKEAKAANSEVKKEAAKPKNVGKPKVNDADRANSQTQKKK